MRTLAGTLTSLAGLAVSVIASAQQPVLTRVTDPVRPGPVVQHHRRRLA